MSIIPYIMYFPLCKRKFRIRRRWFKGYLQVKVAEGWKKFPLSEVKKIIEMHDQISYKSEDYRRKNSIAYGHVKSYRVSIDHNYIKIGCTIFLKEDIRFLKGVLNIY